MASKIQAYSAASNSGAGFFQGGFTGRDSVREERGVVHGREFVFDNEKTNVYRASLFEPLYTGRLQDIDWQHPAMQTILPSLLPDLELPGRMRAERLEVQRVQHEHSFNPMRQEFAQLHARLGAIEASNERMADKPDRVPLSDGNYLEITENGSTHLKKLS